MACNITRAVLLDRDERFCGKGRVDRDGADSVGNVMVFPRGRERARSYQCLPSVESFRRFPAISRERRKRGGGASFRVEYSVRQSELELVRRGSEKFDFVNETRTIS